MAIPVSAGMYVINRIPDSTMKLNNIETNLTPIISVENKNLIVL